MKKWIALPLAALVIGGTGCASVEPDSYSEQGKTTQEAPAPAKKDAKDAPPKWVGHMNEVRIGMSQSEVKAILGKPDDTDSTETSVPDFDADTMKTTEKTLVMDNWTYGDMFSDADGDDVWMLSFQDGKLDSKSRI
jgi:hypothetical protein